MWRVKGSSGQNSSDRKLSDTPGKRCSGKTVVLNYGTENFFLVLSGYRKVLIIYCHRFSVIRAYMEQVHKI